MLSFILVLSSCVNILTLCFLSIPLCYGEIFANTTACGPYISCQKHRYPKKFGFFCDNFRTKKHGMIKHNHPQFDVGLHSYPFPHNEHEKLSCSYSQQIRDATDWLYITQRNDIPCRHRNSTEFSFIHIMSGDQNSERNNAFRKDNFTVGVIFAKTAEITNLHLLQKSGMTCEAQSSTSVFSSLEDYDSDKLIIPLPVNPFLSVFPLPAANDLLSGAKQQLIDDAKEGEGRTACSNNIPSSQPTPTVTAGLPPGEYKPLQSLGQNFLKEEGVCRRIVNSFVKAVRQSELNSTRRCIDEKLKNQSLHMDLDSNSKRMSSSGVVELGPGTGSLTRFLFQEFPDMIGVDVDARSLSLLSRRLPGLSLIKANILQLNFSRLASLIGRLKLIGNLPFYLATPLLFSLIDARHHVDVAILMLQKEVADRLIAKPGTPNYCRLSVVFSIFAKTEKLFDVPRHLFYPAPSVDASLVKLQFSQESNKDLLKGSDPAHLKKVLHAAFGKKRKMLRQSLLDILPEGVDLPKEYGPLRPQALSPYAFVEVTKKIFRANSEISNNIWSRNNSTTD